MFKIEKALNRVKLNESSQEEAITSAEVELSETPEPSYRQTKIVLPSEPHLERHRVLGFLDDPRFVDYYNMLRTQVLDKTRPKGHNTIMMTSVADGEGTTLTSINLAVSIAKEVKQTVLLVDTDLRNPTIHKYLGYNPKEGLSDYLVGDLSLSELLINPGIDKLVVLLGGQPVPGSTEILGSPKMEALVQEMKHRYPDRYVIFDCPSVLDSADALVFSAHVDGIILVVESGSTPRERIRKAVDLLKDRNLLGSVMNKAKELPHIA